MEERTRIMLADYLQAAEIETHILVQEEDSVRADWWRASCGLHDWYTTGSRPNVEEAAAHHVAWDHPACAAVDPNSPADTPVYCRQLPGHSDDHTNGGRSWANEQEPATRPGRLAMADDVVGNTSPREGSRPAVKRAVIPVSMELIHELLQLPDDVEILHSTIGNYGLTLDLIITAPDMADLDPLMMPPRAIATYTHENGTRRIVSLDYPREPAAEEAPDR